tara:strand:+ start:1075 stop:2391 length:1317 start_codon:yes stop_codon:yes gene_type:complete
MSEIKVNTITKRTGSTLTIGESGTTVTLASGASQSGFKDIDWQSVINADGSTTTTAEAGKGYFINTFSSAHTINLPSSPSAGDTVAFVDYAGTFGTNNVTVGRGGSNIQGIADDATLDVSQRSTTFVYSDATKGWIPVNDNTTANYTSKYTSATGGTETTSGNFKIHTFNSSSNFVVSEVGNSGGGSAVVGYLVLAGGAGGGATHGGGGGAGGFREGRAANDSYTVSPLNAPAGITVSAQTYPITVGGGGAGSPTGGDQKGSPGSSSIFSTITSAGGGSGGGGSGGDGIGENGGSGGGGGNAGNPSPGGSGNTPPVSPPQGNPGGAGNNPGGTGGGGGAGAAAADNNSGNVGGTGANGVASSITGSSVTRAGGGGGGASGGGTAPGGSGGGADGKNSAGGTAPSASANTGAGGGGGGSGGAGGSGGSGVVILRYKYQN